MGEKSRLVCPVERAGGLDTGIRRWLQNPKKILDRYIREGMEVLDLGCGPGFFSIEIAEMVGGSGRVIASDLQEGMLQKLKEKIRGTEIEKRIKLHRCGESKIGIPEHVDFVLAFYVIHELPDPRKFLDEIKTILKPGGQLLIVEPKIFRVSKEDFEATVKTAEEIGFKPVEKPKVIFGRTMLLKNG